MPTDTLSTRTRAELPVHRPRRSLASLTTFDTALRKADSTLREQHGKTRTLFRPASNGAVTLLDLDAELTEARRRLQGRLNAALQAAGVDARRSLAFQAAHSDGLPALIGDHADKASIEALFEQDPDLVGDLHRVGSLSRVIRAGADAVEFQAAFRTDPETAVVRYAHLFSSRYVATLTLADGLLDVTTERIPA